MNTTIQKTSRPSFDLLRQKIGWLCEMIRWLIVAYLIWTLYRNLAPLMAPTLTAAEWNTYWGLPPDTVTVTKVFINRAIVMITFSAAAVMGFAVWKLMGAYLAGQIFSIEAAGRLKWVGTTALVAALVDIAVRPFMLGTLSSEILKKVGWLDWIDPTDLLYVLIALFVFALGHIQGTAAEINNEHQQFV